MKKVDFLIIGQGLAGTCMAIELLRAKKSFIVIDDGKENASSIANGIINPITGQRFVKSWNYDLFLPIAKELYQYWEKALEQDFFYEKPILKLLPTPLEANLYEVKVNKEGYEKLLNKAKKNTNPYLKTAYTGCIQGGFYLDCLKFIRASRNYLLTGEHLLKKAFNFIQLESHENGFIYEHIHAKHLIFCQGYTGIENPFFPNLPFVPTKGQIMKVIMQSFTSEAIVQKNGILSPQQDGSFLMGATYEWNFEHDEPDESGKMELIEKLQQMVDDQYTVIQHTAAIRPTTKDRKPLLGRSEKHPNAYILNGLGTKGVLMAPYLAKEILQMVYNDVQDISLNWNRSSNNI